MQKLNRAIILILLSAFAVSVVADDDLTQPPPMPGAAATGTAATTTQAAPAPTMDPTLAFFSALGNCTPGTYTEKNILATEVGPATLNQTIIGPSNSNLTCKATLSTPDERTMSCAFPMADLTMFNDPHFMQGMLNDTTDDPDQDSINADLRWSQLKADHCELD